LTSFAAFDTLRSVAIQAGRRRNPAVRPEAVQNIRRTTEEETMSGDSLSDVLRAVRLRGAVFFYVEGSDPWVVETPPSCEIIPAILPGVEHLMPFHWVSRGSCWASLLDGEPVRLEGGDLVLFPLGDHHVMSSAPGLRAMSVDPSVYFAPRPPQLPFSLRITAQGMTTAGPSAGGDVKMQVVCGFLGCDARPFNPLLASMPRVLRMPAVAGGGNSWVSNILHSMVDESNRKRPGGEAVLERMSEMLFIEALRAYLDQLPVNETGWLAATRDVSVGRALGLMHQYPAQAWTLEQLGKEAGLSRSSFHERFVHFLGQSPIQYLAQWRMQLAAGRLRDTDEKVLEIASSVGYESEDAFARAFKRAVGQSPGAWRRTRRAGSERQAPTSPVLVA
jgi:AraC-like DNA-binding protein